MPAALAGFLFSGVFAGVAVGCGYFLYAEGERLGGAAVVLLGLLASLTRIAVLLAA